MASSLLLHCLVVAIKNLELNFRQGSDNFIGNHIQVHVTGIGAAERGEGKAAV